MHLILCHTTADFDTLGAAVGLACCQPGSRIVLTGGCHPTVQDFLALHRDEYPLIERRSVTPAQIKTLSVVDTIWRDRLGKAAEWLDLPHVAITVYDHHPADPREASDPQVFSPGDIPAQHWQLEAVGATTTLIVEKLRASQVALSPTEATVMALGIHVDTGSLTFDHTTTRDAEALAWLMGQGIRQSTIAQYVEPGLSPLLQDLLIQALSQLRTQSWAGYTLASVRLNVTEYIPGLSRLAGHLMDLTAVDALLLAAWQAADPDPHTPQAQKLGKLTIIGRSRFPHSDLNQLLAPLGGGGHARSAAVTLRTDDPDQVLQELCDRLQAMIPKPLLAYEVMSSPVRTIRPDTRIEEAQRILLRYGHSGLCVVTPEGQLVGIISRRDLDIALHHGFGHAPVRGYMSTEVKTIAPDTPLPEIEALILSYGIGRLPVLAGQRLVGIVTRTDVLRQLHPSSQLGRSPANYLPSQPRQSLTLDQLRQAIAPELVNLLAIAADLARHQGWNLYLVGGAVRDILLAELAGHDQPLTLQDLDLVVDGCHGTISAAIPVSDPIAPSQLELDSNSDSPAALILAQALQAHYPQARLQTHGQFQTAALLWPRDVDLGPLLVDLATARTEFYLYPAANPQVEASSIRQDLYRRDFTLNAMALKLTELPPPEQVMTARDRPLSLLDFFGGWQDLRSRTIRVLHANSFIEDPTRIYRAVRFAMRLNCQIEPQTTGYIRHAMSQLSAQVLERASTWQPDSRAPALQTRLKNELRYILQAPYWRSALEKLGELGALACLHPALQMTPALARQLRRAEWGLRLGDPNLTADWELRLALVIAQVPVTDRALVAQNLQLTASTIQRLANLAAAETEIWDQISNDQPPSQQAACLERWDRETLILVGLRGDRNCRRQIWHYLVHLSQVIVPINGHDLRQLGYKPGPQFREMLQQLRSATLDGQFGDHHDPLAVRRDRAIAYLRQRYGS